MRLNDNFPERVVVLAPQENVSRQISELRGKKQVTGQRVQGQETISRPGPTQRKKMTFVDPHQIQKPQKVISPKQICAQKPENNVDDFSFWKYLFFFFN